MKILVTGGAGYIGSVLCGYLLRCGHAVRVVDTFVHWQNSLACYVADPDFDIFNVDCRRAWDMQPHIAWADVIIPLAAVVGAPACARDPGLAWSLNYGAVETICNYARDDQWIVYPNTNSGYGTTGDAPCTEETPLRPISDYGRSKKMAEERVMERKNSVTLRLATAFGASPRMRLDLLVNDFVYRIMRDRSLCIFDPDARRNFVHVGDIASAFVHVIDRFETMRGEVYNLGNTKLNMTKGDLASRVTATLGGVWVYTESGSDPDKRDYLVSNEKIEATGWRPMFSLDHGIEELRKLYVGLSNSRYGNV